MSRPMGVRSPLGPGGERPCFRPKAMSIFRLTVTTPPGTRPGVPPERLLVVFGGILSFSRAIKARSGTALDRFDRPRTSFGRVLWEQNAAGFPILLSCQCPVPREHWLRALPREHRYNVFIPAASALLDMLCRERQLATPTAATDQLGASVSLWKRTAAVHIRAGEVIDMSPHSVDAMLEKQTRFGSKCHATSNSEAGRPWTGTPCMEVHAFRAGNLWVGTQKSPYQIDYFSLSQ